MELIEEVEQILKELEIEEPIIVDIIYDEQNNISGFISSKSFNKISDYEAQSKIWKKLKHKLSDDKLIKILGIFSELRNRE